jgi:beta-glucanase (GH16 family)
MFKMRFFYSIICICLFFSTSIFSQSWNLIWSDEFNGSTLDTSKWIHDIGTGSQYGLYGWGNSELQYYQPQNTILNNGSVKIIANLEPNGIVDSWNNTMYYSSSKITTKGTFDFRYGKVEASIKTVDGQGFWPAFWMLPTGGSWPCDGEIDIMEQWGSDGPSNTTTGAAHAGTCPGGSTYQSSSHVISNGSYADNFHVYSIEWQPGLITWYVDNIQFLQVTPSSYPNINWPFNSNNWYLMFNLAITSSGPNSNTVFPSQIEIDWVRIYENTGGVSGCTDSLAQNYNPNATNDNGLCEYLVSFEVNLNCATNISAPSVVYITSPTVNWDCNTYALSDSNSDGIWTGNFVLPNGSFDYIYCTDGWTDSESSGLITAMQNGASCAPITDYSTYANRAINITSDTSISNVWGSCSSCIGGCTSPTATNYNSNAGYDDGSCTYNTNFNVTFQVDMNNVTVPFTLPEVNGTFNSWCGSCASLTDVNNDNIWEITLSVPPGYYEYKFSSDNWNVQEDLLNAGNCVVSAWGYTNRFLNITSDTILDLVCWGSCAECISSSVYGCTDPLATNYYAGATIDDGTCTYTSTCTNPFPTNAYVTELIHDRVRVNWDNMNDTSSSCMITQYRIRYREVGTSTWSLKNMVNTGLCLFGLNTNSKKILGLTPSTTYEYYMKAWYCGGGVSTWSAIQNFTTADECPNVINFAVSTPTTTQAEFTWDTTAAYSFARIKLRVDTTGAVWTSAGGFGVFYPALTKDKNGLTPGTSYRAQARTWCDPTGGAYRSTSWSPLVFWTQPTSIRLEGGSSINSLAIYPNPSRDIFNVSFTSDTKQNLKVRIMNVIGEELLSDDLEQFIGEYTKQIDLSNNAKGIYFLEIKLNDNLIVNKLVLF